MTARFGYRDCINKSEEESRWIPTWWFGSCVTVQMSRGRVPAKEIYWKVRWLVWNTWI